MKLRYVSIGGGALAGIVLLVLSFLFLAPETRFATHAVNFEFRGDQVAGQLHVPLSGASKSLNCVVFVHGDGEMDAGGLGYYRPYFNQFADNDWCSFSWDKPGVGASNGNWLHMGMADRAALVGAAITALRANDVVKIDQVGLIGFSQAGWVLPKIVPDTHNVAFYIFVSPAVNWMRQSAYMTGLRQASDPIDAAATKTNDQVDQLLIEGASHAAFLELAAQNPLLNAEDFSADRWQFVAKNARADLTQDLENLTQHPVLLFAGGRDGQVDARETVETFKTVQDGPYPEIYFYDRAGHSMLEVDAVRPMGFWDGVMLLVRVELFGSDAFVEGYWAAMTDFIAAQFTP